MTGRHSSELPSPEMVRQSFKYDADTGTLIRSVASGPVKAGDRAGGVGKNGYIYVSFCGKPYLAHRLIWCWMTGE